MKYMLALSISIVSAVMVSECSYKKRNYQEACITSTPASKRLRTVGSYYKAIYQNDLDSFVRLANYKTLAYAKSKRTYALGITRSRLDPLEYAAYWNNMPVVSYLLNSPVYLSKLVLPAAVAGGNIAMVDYLIKEVGLPIYTRDKGLIPVAAITQNRAMIKYLLKHGANYQSTFDGANALHTAAAKGLITMIKLFLSKDLAIDSTTDCGQTALMLAAAHGHVLAARYLIEQGAQVLAVDKQGNSALDYAIAAGHKAIVSYLIEQGADVNGHTDNPLVKAHALFNCTICFGSYAPTHAITTGCGNHTMCRYCYQSWSLKDNRCPFCRGPL